MTFCMMPGCQTTAGCKCDPQPSLNNVMSPALVDFHKALLDLYRHVNVSVADDLNENVRVYVQELEAEIERLHAALIKQVADMGNHISGQSRVTPGGLGGAIGNPITGGFMETVIARVHARLENGDPRIIVVDDRAFVAATCARKSDAEIVLIRAILGLGPMQDVVSAVRVLHSEGREALEKLRGQTNDG